MDRGERMGMACIGHILSTAYRQTAVKDIEHYSIARVLNKGNGGEEDNIYFEERKRLEDGF